MSDHRTDPFDLDSFFEAEKKDTSEPSAEFLANVLADATLVQNQLGLANKAPKTSTGFWRTLNAVLGGWPTFAGLATATIAGVWIGVSPPQGLDTLTDSVLGNSFDYSDYLPSFDSVLTEG
ncbi:hypothetical protein [Falsihalocynthiibacter arcticus]|uniref:Dihydroorotate dehydrogenase n=1 Tax=Falsihalocynthiibacter arcticus TaxID=1579316 RepID=A0A126UZV3_9RHOB|nr:hypothetical protein [Falsihalocynthiibacter arcticus]AML51602.1 hypothetical protein RC74_10310 [Falsihalocynthiibacter arcticus]